MTINHSHSKGVRRLRRERTEYSDISEEKVGEEETRSTNEVGTVATMATDRLEDTPSHSSRVTKRIVNILKVQPPHLVPEMVPTSHVNNFRQLLLC